MNRVVKFGLLAGIGFILVNLLVFMMQAQNTVAAGFIGWLKYVVLGFMIYMAAKDQRRAQNDVLSFGQGLGTGVLVSTVSGIVNAIFMYIYLAFINPEFLNSVYDKASEAMEKQSGNSDQMEMAQKIMHGIMSPGMMAFFSIIGVLFWGLIISLIIAAIVRRDEDMSINRPPHGNME